AVPLPVMSDIEIYPELSAQKQRVLRELPYFEATRFLFQTYTRFWHEEGLSGYARSDQGLEVWDSTYDLPGKAGILGATVGGALGHRLMTLSEDAAVPYGRELVAQSLPQIQKGVQIGVAQRWADDPLAKGAFAVFKPGQMTTLMPGISAPEGIVTFAD